ncbi:prepilin-type N-terminal cleavage/methylation domain-containing protein [Lysinibacillus sp. FSL K6-0232]|uniref:prepilin-type N-terminal cleavage/methylation domain-containing protein n=1 Tax=Lysinibacillus sp. FSL K6-0232 TaxID=2921425 RepID=UPI0030FAB8E7
MWKKWKNKKLLKNEKGLTLVELLAVIVILAIIAAIAVPAIGNIIDKSKDRAILAEASNILAGAKIAYIDGVCEENGTCNTAALQQFVDGIDLTEHDASATYADNEWSISYKRFGELRTEILGDITLGTNNTLTEQQLNTALTNAGGEPETP